MGCTLALGYQSLWIEVMLDMSIIKKKSIFQPIDEIDQSIND